MVDFNNRYFKVHSIVVDEFGIDPLKDKMAARLARISSYELHIVSQEERGALDLISFNKYGSEDYWWHLMVYNGIASWREIVEGVTIKIPDKGAIIALTTEMAQMSSPVQTITI